MGRQTRGKPQNKPHRNYALCLSRDLLFVAQPANSPSHWHNTHLWRRAFCQKHRKAVKDGYGSRKPTSLRVFTYPAHGPQIALGRTWQNHVAPTRFLLKNYSALHDSANSGRGTGTAQVNALWTSTNNAATVPACRNATTKALNCKPGQSNIKRAT